MPLAQRSAGCRLHVLSEEEMAQVRSVELDGRLQWVRVGPDLCDVTRLDEAADLFYDADEPSRSMAGRAVWLHDYLGDALAGELNGSEGERLTCAIPDMTETSYGFLSGAVASVYSGRYFRVGTCEMGVAKRVLCAIGKFFLMWMRFVARIILLFWHYES